MPPCLALQADGYQDLLELTPIMQTRGQDEWAGAT
jgi:hypothetical protein